MRADHLGFRIALDARAPAFQLDTAPSGDSM
jgi:hypothetical protein